MAISIIAASGGDFTTIVAWEASLPSALTEQEVARVRGTITEGAYFSPTVITTPTFSLLIEPDTGEDTTYSPTDGKAIIRQPFLYANRFYNGYSEHLHVKNMSMQFGGSQGLYQAASLLVGNPLYENIFFYNSDHQSGADGLTGQSGAMVQLVNCLVVGYHMHGGGKQTDLIENCTFIHSNPTVANATIGLQGEIPLRCYGAGYQSSYNVYSPSSDGTDNAADDASADLVDNAALADQYTDPLNYDWTFKAGNALEGAATAGADIGFVLPVVGGGASLAINNGDSSHGVDQVSIEHFQSLLVTISGHSQSVDIVSLTQGQSLAINDGSHSHAAGTVVVNQLLSLTPNEIFHTHSLDNISLGQGQGLVVNNIQHSMTSDAVTLAHLQSLITFNSTHGLSSHIAGLFDPLSYRPSPDRTYNAETANRKLSAADSGRKISPTNNRTLRI